MTLYAAEMITVTTDKKKSFSFMEIVMAALILALAVAGIISTFITARGMIKRSETRLGALNVARSKISGLYSEVNASSWCCVTSGLSGSYSGITNQSFPPRQYNWSYEVQPPAVTCGEEPYRIVNFTVNFSGS